MWEYSSNKKSFLISVLMSVMLLQRTVSRLLTYLITYLRTYLLTYILTYVITYWRTYLLTCYLIYLLTYSMEQSPSWGAKQFSASQEIPRISRNPEVHYCIQKCPPPVPILRHLDPVHTATSRGIKKFLVLHWTASSTLCTVLSLFHCIQTHSSYYLTQKLFLKSVYKTYYTFFVYGGWQIG